MAVKDWFVDVLQHYYIIISGISDSVHKKAFNLVRLGYSSISVEDFSLFVGLSTSDAKQGITWTW